MSRASIQRRKAERFNHKRRLRARLLRSPAYCHQLLDEWHAIMRKR